MWPVMKEATDAGIPVATYAWGYVTGPGKNYLTVVGEDTCALGKVYAEILECPLKILQRLFVFAPAKEGLANPPLEKGALPQIPFVAKSGHVGVECLAIVLERFGVACQSPRLIACLYEILLRLLPRLGTREMECKESVELLQPIGKGFLDSPRDPKMQRFLPDRYVEGISPRCGYDGARGDQCDNCGSTLDALELISPRSRLSDATPEPRASGC